VFVGSELPRFASAPGMTIIRQSRFEGTARGSEAVEHAIDAAASATDCARSLPVVLTLLLRRPRPHPAFAHHVRALRTVGLGMTLPPDLC
jgi:hypothetical protein